MKEQPHDDMQYNLDDQVGDAFAEGFSRLSDYLTPTLADRASGVIFRHLFNRLEQLAIELDINEK